MQYTYTCPLCGANSVFYQDQPLWLLPMCPNTACSGRLEFASSVDAPQPPPLPAPPSTQQIAWFGRTKTYAVNGTFCKYILQENLGTWEITFDGCLTANESVAYSLQLKSTGDTTFQVPSYSDVKDDVPSSQRYVKNGNGQIDWIIPPAIFPINEVKAPKYKMLSFGHGKGFTTPVRIQLGRQDENEQHSGSGLIHIMFSHNKTNLQGVQDILKNILSSHTLGAVYVSKQQYYGAYRYFFLSRSNTPNCLVADLQGDHFRLITIYKMDSITSYNKFKAKKDEYKVIYAWDSDKY